MTSADISPLAPNLRGSLAELALSTSTTSLCVCEMRLPEPLGSASRRPRNGELGRGRRQRTARARTGIDELRVVRGTVGWARCDSGVCACFPLAVTNEARVCGGAPFWWTSRESSSLQCSSASTTSLEQDRSLRRRHTPQSTHGPHTQNLGGTGVGGLSSRALPLPPGCARDGDPPDGGGRTPPWTGPRVPPHTHREFAAWARRRFAPDAHLRRGAPGPTIGARSLTRVHMREPARLPQWVDFGYAWWSGKAWMRNLGLLSWVSSSSGVLKFQHFWHSPVVTVKCHDKCSDHDKSFYSFQQLDG